MKQETPSPWPPKPPQGQVETDNINGCDYVNGEKITSSWSNPQKGGKGNAPSR